MTMTGVITQAGRPIICQLQKGVSGVNPLLYVAIGDGTTALADTQYALENEITRVLATVTNDTNRLKLVAQFTGLTEGDSYSEFGVFNASIGGIMISRHGVYGAPPGTSTTVSSRLVPSDGIVNATIFFVPDAGSY